MRKHKAWVNVPGTPRNIYREVYLTEDVDKEIERLKKQIHEAACIPEEFLKEQVK
jgi:Zn-dependent M32 family carboxypeptidase